MKKLGIFALALALTASLCACGRKDKNATTPTTVTPTTIAPTTTPTTPSTHATVDTVPETSFPDMTDDFTIMETTEGNLGSTGANDEPFGK